MPSSPQLKLSNPHIFDGSLLHLLVHLQPLPVGHSQLRPHSVFVHVCSACMRGSARLCAFVVVAPLCVCVGGGCVRLTFHLTRPSALSVRPLRSMFVA